MTPPSSKNLKRTVAFILGFILWTTAFHLEFARGDATSNATTSVAAVEDHLTEQEFRSLAEELSKNVNLFRDLWLRSSQAEFFGGTTRDYLYWLKKQFRGLKGRPQIDAQIARLRALPLIDVRDFIIGDSDVDVVSASSISIDPRAYGVRKIDTISANRFDPKTVEGQNELKQGYIPVEKIRLGKNGFVVQQNFGDGVTEIFQGRPTLHLASDSDFKSTYYAQKKLNHPILLVLRFLRLLAVNYYCEYGKAYPQKEVLFDVDNDSKRQVESVVKKLSLNHGELREFLQNSKFLEWFNATVQKAFRSYTNPTAAKLLIEHFHIDQILASFEQILPYNHYLFAKQVDEGAVQANLKSFNTTKEKLFQPAREAIANLILYHGTRTEEAFRGILFQGILPSSSGNAGEGLYAVEKSDIDFAIDWAGDKDRVVEIHVKPSAKIIDIRSGEGQRVYSEFKRKHLNYNSNKKGGVENSQSLESQFADATGADILVYPYDVKAFVVKNSSVLERPNGYARKLLTVGQLIEKLSAINSFDALFEATEASRLIQLSDGERELINQSVADRAFSILIERARQPRSQSDLVKILEIGRYWGLFERNLWMNVERAGDRVVNVERGIRFKFVEKVQELDALLQKHFPQFGKQINEVLESLSPDTLASIALTLISSAHDIETLEFYFEIVVKSFYDVGWLPDRTVKNRAALTKFLTDYLNRILSLKPSGSFLRRMVKGVFSDFSKHPEGVLGSFLGEIMKSWEPRSPQDFIDLFGQSGYEELTWPHMAKFLRTNPTLSDYFQLTSTFSSGNLFKINGTPFYTFALELVKKPEDYAFLLTEIDENISLSSNYQYFIGEVYLGFEKYLKMNPTKKEIFSLPWRFLECLLNRQDFPSNEIGERFINVQKMFIQKVAESLSSSEDGVERRKDLFFFKAMYSESRVYFFSHLVRRLEINPDFNQMTLVLDGFLAEGFGAGLRLDPKWRMLVELIKGTLIKRFAEAYLQSAPTVEKFLGAVKRLSEIEGFRDGGALSLAVLSKLDLFLKLKANSSQFEKLKRLIHFYGNYAPDFDERFEKFQNQKNVRIRSNDLRDQFNRSGFKSCLNWLSDILK